MMVGARNGAWAKSGKTPFIESHGVEFIDTLFKADSETIVELDMQFTRLSYGQMSGGANQYVNNGRFACGIDVDYSSNRDYWYCGIGNVNAWANQRIDTDRHLFVIDAKNKVFKVDDLSTNVNYSSISPEVHSFAIGIRNGYYESHLISYSYARYFGVKIRKGQLYMNLVPFNNKSVGCLIDTESGIVYPNSSGVGNFTYGELA